MRELRMDMTFSAAFSSVHDRQCRCRNINKFRWPQLLCISGRLSSRTSLGGDERSSTLLVEKCRTAVLASRTQGPDREGDLPVDSRGRCLSHSLLGRSKVRETFRAYTPSRMPSSLSCGSS